MAQRHLSMPSDNQGKISDAVRPENNDSASTTDLYPTQNFGSGLLLRKNDVFEVHSMARRFRRTKKHLATLRESLELHGQRNDAVVDFLPDGTPRLLDGCCRQEILFAKDQPLACRPITDQELNGKSVEQWIIANNLAGSEGRSLTDTQRAVQIVELKDQLTEAIEKARERSRGGVEVDESEKGSAAAHLARVANVKESRVQQVLDVVKEARSEKERELFYTILWDGKCAVSKLLAVAKLPDAQARGDAIAAIRDGDKEQLARALGDVHLQDELRVTVPNNLRPLFEQRQKALEAVKLLTKVTDTLLPAAQVEQKHIDALRYASDVLKRSLPHSMCGHCNFTGRDEDGHECSVCAGKRYLTTEEFEGDKQDRSELMMKAR
jgi:hypothetical protein